MLETRAVGLFILGGCVFKPGDRVKRLDSNPIYTVVAVTKSGEWMLLDGLTAAYKTNQFILYTGKQDVPNDDLDVGLRLLDIPDTGLVGWRPESTDIPVWPMPEPEAPKKCECGSAFVGSSGHSTWCPAYVK
jgi:hypothetical protein